MPLYSGVINFVGAIAPSGSTLDDANLVNTLSPYADTIKLFSEDGSLATAGVYFSDGAVMTDDFASNDGAKPLGSASSYIINVGVDSYWNVPAAYTN